MKIGTGRTAPYFCWWVLPILLLATFGALAGPPSNLDTNVYLLDLSRRGTFTEIYDCGLRPRRWVSSLNGDCFVEKKYLAFKLPQGEVAKIFAAHCDIKVYSNGCLNTVIAQSPHMTIESARLWMTPIVTTLKRSQQDLDSYLKSVSTRNPALAQRLRIEGSGSDFILETPWPGTESDKPVMSVSLSWRRDKVFPITMAIIVTWIRPMATMLYPTEPLQAPRGYDRFPLFTEPYMVESLRLEMLSGHLPQPLLGWFFIWIGSPRAGVVSTGPCSEEQSHCLLRPQNTRGPKGGEKFDD